MSKGNIIPFAEKKAQARRNAAFLELIDADIAANPERVMPIPKDLFARMDALKAKAESNRREDLLEM